MREIKFRAWDKAFGKMINFDDTLAKEWTLGLSLWGTIIGFDINALEPEVDYKTAMATYPERFELMQYTGLKDSKRTEEYPEGQKIYEGDVIKAVALANDHNQRGAITISAVEYWKGNACLSITHVPLYPFIVGHGFEVIGNVWEDGDLLNDC